MSPRHITYTIWITIALLGAVCLLIPKGGWQLGQWTLRWPTLSEALDLSQPVEQEEPIIPTEPTTPAGPTQLAESTQVTTPTTPATPSSKQVAESEPTIENDTILPMVDARHYLTAFYNALDSADRMPVRVVHYGDSQIEEDRISSILRELWQKEYGGGGVGLLPLHQTIPTSSLRQWISINGTVQSTQGGPKRYLIYGPSSMRLKSDDYGVMGQVASLNNNLISGSEHIVMNIAPYDKKIKSFNYFNRLRIVADDIKVSINQPSTDNPDSLVIGSAVFALPDSTTRCTMHFKGRGKVYGVSLETPTGVIVDNIPMRGCSGNIFTRIDSLALSSFYQETNTRLIILQYGGNMIPSTKNRSTVNGYVNKLREQIHYLRACAPQASILFIGPSDMSTRINGVLTTYPMVPYMDEQLALMAQEEQIAYWSMYKAMGGKGSMISWRSKGLAGSDYVHFTRKGASKVGKLLYEWLKWEQESDTLPPPESTLLNTTTNDSTQH